MRVAALWRYPVKSMAGERLETVDVGLGGVAGDRVHAVVDVESGKVASAKHPRLWGDLLRCRASFVEGADGPVVITLPDGTTARSDDADVDARLSAALGRAVRLAARPPTDHASYLAVWPDGVMPEEVLAQVAVDGGGEDDDGTLTDLRLAQAAPPDTFFDLATLHVLTSATLHRLDELAPASRFAVERYRPNIVLDGATPFAENDWTGATLEVGDAVRAPVLMPTMRCIMTTLPQGDLPRDNDVLRTVTRHNRIEIPGIGTWSCVGAYASVAAGGTAALGDEVSVDPTASRFGDATAPEMARSHRQNRN